MKQFTFRWDTCPEADVVLTTTDEEAKVIDAFLTFAEMESLFDSGVNFSRPEEKRTPKSLSDYYPK